MIRRILCLILVLGLLSALPVTAEAASKEDLALYIQSMIRYYRFYQEDAEHVIRDLLKEMEAVDPQQAAIWENIMEDWIWVNAGMTVYEDVLPDGLPQDDSLCIVVMGYGLKEDGSMKEELVDRLVVALSSAIKYPNAWILVTGGQTSEAKGVTEAGQMAAWLQKKGVDKSRIIQEKQSLSTTANAVNSYRLLNSSYPQVTSAAVITSDYHVTWSCAMLAAVANYKSGYDGGRAIEVIGCAVCDTGASADTLETQVWGVCTITGIEYEEYPAAPVLYEPEETMPPIIEAAPVETDEEGQPVYPQQPAVKVQPETVEEKQSILPVVLLTAAGILLWLAMPKKPRKKRKRPEWNWDV